MSSMLGAMIKSGLLLASISGAALASGTVQRAMAPLGAVLSPIFFAQTTPAPTVAAMGPVIDEWRRLQQSDGLPFSDYANFMLAHPGWPGETSRRAAAETALSMGSATPDLTIRYFDRFAPITAAGRLRYAEALLAMGQSERAREQARLAWRTGLLRPSDEARLISGYAGGFAPADHDARMDKLLWQDATSAAMRQLGFVSLAKRDLFAARIAFRTSAPNAAQLDAVAGAIGRSDPGFIADRARWLRNNGQSIAARAYLAQPRTLTSLPGDVEKFHEMLLVNARAAAADGQYSTAYDIARQVDDAFAPGTDISVLPLGIRDEYTSLTWLAGQTAMKQLGRPADAVGMFDRYSRGSKTPQTQSKGLYWAGRAAEASGNRAVADGYYARAAGFSDLYYGQLAAERLRQPLRSPPAFTTAGIDAGARSVFYTREVVRAAQYLGTVGRWEEQSLFVRQIALDAKTGPDHVLAVELSRSIGRPDLGVMVGRSALLNGLTDYTAAGYPSVPVPDAHAGNWTMIHAIARQESQFDRAAISHAGARGLMQLMPGTAREMAGKLGLGYDREALTVNTDYNIQLGSGYFQRMLSYYGGSYPLAVAAYNAGPGNVNKWIAANGDPRMPGVDVIDWVEAIPIFETKNYVQRVLENAVVYDLMQPARARSRGPAHLSWYLGKRVPG